MSQRKFKLTLHATIHQTDTVMAIKNFCSIEVPKDTFLLSTRHLRRSLPEDNWWRRSLPERCKFHRAITCKYQTIYGSITHILTSYLVMDGLKWCLIHYFAISCTPLPHGNRDDLGVHVPPRPLIYEYLLPQAPRNPPMFPQRPRSSQQQLLVMTSNSAQQTKKQYMKHATLRGTLLPCDLLE